MEAVNKNVRSLREHGARKTSVEQNFIDVFHHLVQRSSPLLAELDREKPKRKPRVHKTPDNFEEYVASFFLVDVDVNQIAQDHDYL